MSIRDILLTFLTGIGLGAFIAFVAMADSLPLWLLGVLAILAWVAYIVIVIRDHQRDIKFPIFRVRPPESQNRVIKTPQTTVYDQKEDK